MRPTPAAKQGQQKGERGDRPEAGRERLGGKNGKSGRAATNRARRGKAKIRRTPGRSKTRAIPPPAAIRTAPKDNNKQAQGDGNDRASSDDNASRRTTRVRERTRSKSGSSSKLSASALRDFMSRVAPVLKWIVFAILGLAVLFFLLRSGLQFLANFSDWARRLLDALRNFWANLFGGRKRRTAGVSPLVEDAADQPKRPSPRSPIHSPVGKAAWRRAGVDSLHLRGRAGVGARASISAGNPARRRWSSPTRVGAEVPALEADLHRLADLYARAVYARGGLPGNSVEVLRRFWQRLEAVAEHPLSA